MLLKALKITPYLMTCFNGTGNLSKPKLNAITQQNTTFYYANYETNYTGSNNIHTHSTQIEEQSNTFLTAKSVFMSTSIKWTIPLEDEDIQQAWILSYFEITSDAEGMKSMFRYIATYITTNTFQPGNANTDIYVSYNQNLSDLFTYFTETQTDLSTTALENKRDNVLNAIKPTSSKYEYTYAHTFGGNTQIDTEENVDNTLNTNPIQISSQLKTYILVYTRLQEPITYRYINKNYFYPEYESNTTESTCSLRFNNEEYTGQTLEVIDVGGIMFQVLTMPFTFISSAFNLTMFAGTPYQINVSNLFLSIIALLIFAVIIKIILGFIKK